MPHEPSKQSGTELRTYSVGRQRVDLVRAADGRLRWVCDCAEYRSSRPRQLEPWCRHVKRAQAQRSIERLMMKTSGGPRVVPQR